MGIFGAEFRWIGWRLLVVILAAVLAVEIGKLHLLVGVEAQVSVPPNRSPLQQISAPPNFPPLPPRSNISGFLNDKINEFANNFRTNNRDCFTFLLSSLRISRSLTIRNGTAIHASSQSSRNAPPSQSQSDEKETFDENSLITVAEACVQGTVPDLLLRVCNVMEMEEYTSNINRVQGFGVPPNINCNDTAWPKACNPGWAAATAQDYTIPTNSIPIRVSSSKQCCAGFFCPRGLTCMIPCPMGAYCPSATFNDYTYSCIPYYYPALPGNECGGADVWLSYKDSVGTFCSGVVSPGVPQGQYCPDTITQNTCEKGHYCRVGSTVQTMCTIFGHCNKEGLTSEVLKVYGILFVVLLSVCLLVIYTCGDQCMHIRERRRAKAREIAARQARERVSAAERWRRAKEGAKKKAKAVMLTPTLSRTLSKVCTSRTHTVACEGLLIEEQPDAEDQDSTDPRIRLGWQVDDALEKRESVVNLHNSPSPDVVEGSQDSWSHDLYPVEGRRSIDLYECVQLSPVLSGPLTREDGLPAVKKNKEVPRARKVLANTRSQIYKYAYGEIEKEKVKQQSKPASLKEVVESDEFRAMLAGPKRFQMELRFVDLCLVLKGSGKKILSFVTGELRPSRVTAVMGPSGAGKTTFLNALAGKETGSVITGQVFINGVPGSIQAYKRIIGFVPQDDVVHGSLTVEENLVFSAKYRLPVDMPRRDRVLVVERIINRLNLTSIRNSLVGTVENRGISGGQRKRVNVGLELVIEPSLLLLDEPTSGLDSTSSRLVVQALRREAALGVNVCLVVHQPSYGLFRMFDDVMLFAKGGYTVYMGPVEEMDVYFSSLDFNVPDRINPPDYYMDVLEGEIVPDNDLYFDLKSLPILWMCHHGYRIPQELQETPDGRRIERDDPLRISFDAPKTFVQEVWEELRVYVLVRLDILKTTFSSVKNLSGRQTPGFLSQYFLILGRATKQRFRESRLVVQDYIILLLAGICLGILSNWTDTSIWELGYEYTLIGLSLLVMIASLRTFTVDKLQFWRESSSGVNKLAYFLAKDTVDHFNTLLKPAAYLFAFYFYNDPRATFRSTYFVTLALVYCCSGIAYVVGIILKPQPGQLLCVFLPVVATLVVSDTHTGLLAKIQKVSYGFWALQAYTIANAEKYTGVWLIQRCVILKSKGYSINNFNLCIAILMGYGVLARILAFLSLLFFNRKKQK